jgi:predicted kinase
LLTVAAMLPSQWEKRLVDLNVRKLTDADLDWADIAFISAMTAQRESTQQVIERCKAHGLRIVAGGLVYH